MSQSLFSQFLLELGTRLNLHKIQPDEQGYCAIAFDEVVIHLQYIEDKLEIIAFSTIGELSSDYRETILESLLQANLFWQETHGATFAIESETEQIFIQERFSLGQNDFNQFLVWLEQFTQTSEHWKQKLAIANAGIIDSLLF